MAKKPKKSNELQVGTQTKIWFVAPKTKELVSPYDVFPDDRPIYEASPFTVELASVVVAEDLDGFLRGKNDILVLSKTSLGEQPAVQRVHYFRKGVGAGEFINHVLSDTIFVADDYNGSKLWIELNILEIDTDTGERTGALAAFDSMAQTMGGIFPAVVPYAFAASTVLKVIDKLITALSDDDDVIKVPIALYQLAEPTVGKARLREGSYVAFGTPQNPADFKLENSGELARVDGKPVKASYSVFTVTAAKSVSPEFVTSQKLATLLTQIQDGNKNSVQGTLEFVESTIKGYGSFKKLERYRAISAKGDEATAEEKALLESIASVAELQPYLPKK